MATVRRTIEGGTGGLGLVLESITVYAGTPVLIRRGEELGGTGRWDNPPRRIVDFRVESGKVIVESVSREVPPQTFRDEFAGVPFSLRYVVDKKEVPVGA